MKDFFDFLRNHRILYRKKRQKIVNEISRLLPVVGYKKAKFAKKFYTNWLYVYPVFKTDDGNLFVARMGTNDKGEQIILSLLSISNEKSKNFRSIRWFVTRK